MIYITGDLHGECARFDNPKLKRLKKGDSLIICGDFGFLWDGGKKEEKFLTRLGKKKYNILFVDGAHENYDLLENYPVTEWNGGKVREISGNLRHLLRGQVFELEGKKIFTFGGGEDSENQMYIEAGKWWPQEIPSLDEMREGIRNLTQAGMSVDYIVTYAPAPRMRQIRDGSRDESSSLEMYFQQLAKNVTYERWFFGSMHIDRKITTGFHAVFNDIVPLNLPVEGGRRKK